MGPDPYPARLMATPAAVRFVSCEPLLGALDLSAWTRPGTSGGLDWVIAGGESEPGARPMHSDWIRKLRDQCAAGGVPFFFKKWGAWLPADRADPRFTGAVKGGYWPYRGQNWASFNVAGIRHTPDWVIRVGARAAGATLDGALIQQYPPT